MEWLMFPRRLDGSVLVIVAALASGRFALSDGRGPAPQARLEHSTNVLVVNEQGKPVPGAVITSIDFPSPDWANPVTTDDNGLAKLDWPHYSPGTSAHILVDQADFILQRATAPIGSNPHQVTLRQPSSVQLMARIPGEEGPAWGLTPDFGRIEGLRWAEDEGLLAIDRLDLSPGGPEYPVRLVHLSEQGSCYFSDTIDLRQIDPGQRPPTFPLRKGLEFRGRLAAEVPRPVQNGTVYAVARPSTASPRFADWTRVVPVASDGDFVIESLPPQSGLELLVLCDGWTSAPPTEAEAVTFQESFPHQEPPHEMSVAVVRGYVLPQGAEEVTTIPMAKRATAQINVIDTDGRPVEGAIVNAITFGPLPGDDEDSIKVLERRRAGQPAGFPAQHSKWNRVTTDSNGVASINRFPPGLYKGVPTIMLALNAEHPDWKPVKLNLALKAPYDCTLRFKQKSQPAAQ